MQKQALKCKGASCPAYVETPAQWTLALGSFQHRGIVCVVSGMPRLSVACVLTLISLAGYETVTGKQ